MQVEEEQQGVREAVGVFHKVDDLQPAIDEGSCRVPGW